jgi:hypothetical protein
MNMNIQKTTMMLSLVFALIVISTSVSALPSAYLGGGSDVETWNNWPGGNMDYTSGQTFADYYGAAPLYIRPDVCRLLRGCSADR